MRNRLAASKSLYLQKHAENPIDWWPWSDLALATAREQNKPIFLSIGYSSCHWCTVMEGEAFSDPAVAEFMNANFLPIKVDREERPDIDSIYMQALQMMTGQGGWPLNAFLAPDDLVPFYAGTYFPLTPAYGRPGFLQVLISIKLYYDTERSDLVQRKSTIQEVLVNSTLWQEQTNSLDIDQELFVPGWEASVSVISSKQMGNSFPMVSYAELAMLETRFSHQSGHDVHQLCQQWGNNLALGGIYDHVAGGFHRYTVDPTWTVPHFEKMLYDNGQILEYLSNLWSTGFPSPALFRAVTGTVKWLEREMTAPAGYFYAAQDADSFSSSANVEPEEGAFYVWDYTEIEQLLTTQELVELQRQFTVTPNGNFDGKNVLQRLDLEELSPLTQAALTKLFVARYGETPESLLTFPPVCNNQAAKTASWSGRIPPVTDTKMIVAWNSLMISGLVRAAEVFSQPSYLQLAIASANFILANQFVNGRFHRLNYDSEPVVLAQSEDYAFMIKALLDLQQSALSHSESANYWLQQAIALQDEFHQFHWNNNLYGYFNTASDASENLIVRERSYVDNATPSANGVAIANLVRLALITENRDYLDLAEKTLKAFRDLMENYPQVCPSLFIGLDWLYRSTLIQTTPDHIQSLARKYLPTSIFSPVADLADGSVGIVCREGVCFPPANSLEELLAQINRSFTKGI